MNAKKGFSLVEILISAVIVITLATFITFMSSNSRELARTVGCVNNVKNISMAIEGFQADMHRSPYSLEELQPNYISNQQVFRCPADRDKDSVNSYDRYYIARPFDISASDKVFIACPRHAESGRSVVGYLVYSVDTGQNRTVTHNGAAAEFGATYGSGTMLFSDGTEVTITEGTVGILSSFIDSTSNLYSIIYLPEEENTTISVDKPEGTNSRFEIITPAVIAGVEGTLFTVETVSTDDEISTIVNVTRGIVSVSERVQTTSTEVKSDQQYSISAEKTRGPSNETIQQILDRVPRPPRGRPFVEFLS